jgi:biopolymer transport protein TolR
MAMQLGSRRGGAIAEINVTPMADVMIVLLIIFMVATPVIATAPVRLPAAAHAAERRGERVEVAVKADGSVAVDAAVLATPEQLGEYLVVRAGWPERMQVLIQADQDVSYADLSRVLASCREAGASEIALAANRRLENAR